MISPGFRARRRAFGPFRLLGWLAVAAAAVVVLALSLPTGSPRLAASSSGQLRAVLPSATDPAITRPDAPHLVAPPAAGPGNGLLLVNLGGTDSTPRDYTRFVGVAADSGFHAIGLSYPDLGAVGTACADDLACYGPVRRDIFDGTRAPRATVDPANAIEHRLAALLRTMTIRYPGEGWAAFLRPDGLPRYDHIVFAGHSQGGGEAAYIGKVRVVAGVVMISSVVDSTNSIFPAAPKRSAFWIGTGHLTPLARYTGLVHVDDIFASSVRTNWTTLGLDRLGPATPVGPATAADGSHELLMTQPAAGGARAHLLPVIDSVTPLCPDGGAQLAPVWSYLLRTAAGLPAPAPNTAC